jgi:hypothetical protein
VLVSANGPTVGEKSGDPLDAFDSKPYEAPTVRGVVEFTTFGSGGS